MGAGDLNVFMEYPNTICCFSPVLGFSSILVAVNYFQLFFHSRQTDERNIYAPLLSEPFAFVALVFNSTFQIFPSILQPLALTIPFKTKRSSVLIAYVLSGLRKKITTAALLNTMSKDLTMVSVKHRQNLRFSFTHPFAIACGGWVLVMITTLFCKCRLLGMKKTCQAGK